uniref:Uncharacterized protein n=1 Tax=Russula griseocarnosa TaxID=466936 RepID=A0A650AWI6_9AGAM|nr:hypothetical protein [Russula griseocarnosa]
MTNELILDQNINISLIIIGSLLIIGCSIYYIVKNNNTAIPTNNTEAFTFEEIEASFEDDRYRNLTTVSNENTEENLDQYFMDSDSDTDTVSDYENPFDSENELDSSDIESILNDPDIFMMPNVDFDVCPIEELKFFEFNSLYAKEISENGVTEEDILDFIYSYSKEELATNWINDLFIKAVNLLKDYMI